MRRWLSGSSLFLGALLALGLAGTAHAQAVTTSAVTGTVTDTQGQPLAGIQIVVTNVPTGAVSGTITRSDGRFLVPGLRPGGPYRIEARGIGYASQIEEDITIALGQTARFDFALPAAAVAVEGVTVTAERDQVMSRGRTGASSVISETRIETAPTITRDFTDFTRLVPQITTNTPGTSAAGRNNRFNNIQIDGAVNNDLFGLAASGTPGGQAGARPITLEAIQEFQVVIAPFDVRQGGFTGAGINAITRSGTNNFRGSLSYFGRNQDFVGSYTDLAGARAPDVAEFNQSDLAFSLGGPVLRDRVFFFGAGELSRRSAPMGTVLGVNTVVRQDQVETVRNILVNQYGYDPGAFGQLNLNRESDNFFGRFDFNLSPEHRLTLRHNFVDAFDDNLTRAPRNFAFAEGGYAFNSRTNSTVAQLNSSFGSLFNEFRVGYTTVRDFRAIGQPFPRVTVLTDDGSIVAGPDNFSPRNALDQDVLEITNDVTLPLGRHSITLGTSNEIFRFSNLFTRNPFGNYQFPNVQALEQGLPNRYEYSYVCEPGLPGCLVQGRERAEFPAQRFSIYGQDRWDVMDNLTVTAGLRFDFSRLPQSPQYNPRVDSIYGRRTDEVPNNQLQVNPRFGFNWDVRGDQFTQVRGGTGLFSGRTPFVWISNAYGNTGMDIVRFTCTTSTGVPAFNPDVNQQPRSCQPGVAAQLAPNEINLVDPDFKFPQVWRSSVGFDQRLAFGLIGTLEGVYTHTVSDVMYRNLQISGVAADTTAEGRPWFTRRTAAGLGEIIDITNTDEGWSYNLTAQVQRPFRGGWEVSAAYTFSQARDKSIVGSSQAISNWRFQLTPNDPNEPPLTRTRFEVPHRLLMTGTYQARFLPRFPTDLSFIYVGESGLPYTYVYNGDISNDGSFGNNLVYVPRDASEILFAPARDRDGNVTITPAQSWANLDDFINRVPCLNEARGTIIDRGACRAPWSNRLDLRVAQSVQPFGRHRAQISLDILNFLNVLNRDWGRQEFVGFEGENLLVLASGSRPDAQGRHLYQAFAPRADVYQVADLSSRYQIQLGLRYSF